jgi:hypothetical protein
MSEISDLDQWHHSADHWLTPIEQVKEALQANLQKLDTNYPLWKVKYDTTPQEYQKHDARREFFVTLRVILQNAQLGYIFTRDQLCNEAWWKKQAGEFRLRMADQAIREYFLMVKFFSVHATAMATEETLRAIIRSAPTIFTVAPTAEFQSVHRHILKVIGLQRLEALFEIIRLTRNTIHTNGIFFPKTGKDIRLPFKERQFEFNVGKTLDWLSTTLSIQP